MTETVELLYSEYLGGFQEFSLINRTVKNISGMKKFIFCEKKFVWRKIPLKNKALVMYRRVPVYFG